MTVILCVDRRGGCFFNGRRQSQDRLARQDLLEETAGGRLWMSPYSARQFPDCTAALLSEAGPIPSAPEDFCFLEDLPPAPFLEQAQGLLLYRWDRVYPADRFFPAPEVASWTLRRQTEFPGYSHKTITKEFYTR